MYAVSYFKRKGVTGSALRSHEQSMEYIDATITFSRRCNDHYEELIQSLLVRSINANNIRNRFCKVWFLS